MFPRGGYLVLSTIILVAQPESKDLNEGIEAFKVRDGLKAVELLTPLTRVLGSKARR